MNYLQLLYYSLGYCFRIYRQLSFIKSFLLPKVDAACTAFNYHPNKREAQKIKFYYPLFNHVVNCENYLTIKNRKLTLLETKRLAFISVWATLYDDFIDEERWGKQKLQEIFEKKLPVAERTPKMEVFMAMDDALKAIFTPTPFYKNSLKLAIDWQVVSAKQLESTITLEEVLHISEEKCGNSSLLWASIMDEGWTEKEKQFIYQSGLVGQLVNDAFDARKDILDGGYTYIRKAASMAQAKEIFLNACRQLNQDIMTCNAPTKFKKNTIRRMACIHAFGLVAIEHLQAIDKKYPKPIDWQQVDRSDLITDMSFWRNRLRTVKYAILLAKL
ncbi:class 1 isoprenoid biosynthesis enzyme [Parasediminibacterium sp. JCM 36343]|uniref:class 1 isoprenoid biosynthesis enzyme n=1 Tax=Parasediminibacterium sp. JCM 36343 TaxID=3374279 RepID=UPI00397E2758